MSQQDRVRAAEIVNGYRIHRPALINALVKDIAKALEQRGAEERERCAKKCDAIVGGLQEALRGCKGGGRVGAQIILRIETARGCATAIRETGEKR